MNYKKTRKDSSAKSDNKIHNQNEKLNKEIEIIKKNQTEILDLKIQRMN